MSEELIDFVIKHRDKGNGRRLFLFSAGNSMYKNEQRKELSAEYQFYEKYYKKKSNKIARLNRSPTNDDYNRYFDTYKKRYYDILRETIRHKDKVLDIGCGFGTDHLEMDKSFFTIGIDISRNALKSALNSFRERGKKHFQFLQSDSFSIPIQNTSIDIVTCSEVLEHFENPDPILAEMSRVIKKNGYIIITTPNVHEPFTFLARALIPRKARFFLYKLTKQGSDAISDTQCEVGDFDAHKYKINTISVLKKKFKNHGFSVECINIYSLRSPLAFLLRKYRWALDMWKFFDQCLSVMPFSKYLHWHIVAKLKKV